MDVLTEYEGSSNSPNWIMNKYFSEVEGYITEENAKDTILYARKKFLNALKEQNGPPIIPTVFRNHPERHVFVEERERLLVDVRSAKNPPELPPYRSLFIDDVYLNILCNIRLNKYSGFIKHGEIAKLVCLKRQYCAEDAFEELLSCKPHFYSLDFEKLKLSQFADDVNSNWGPLPTECKNFCRFNLDFSAIYPEDIVSTAIVTCVKCGGFFETVLCDMAKKAIKKDIMYNIGLFEPKKDNNENPTKVICLPTRASSVEGCPFMEGLIGFKPLSAKSVFTRTRVTLFCSLSSTIGLIPHCTKPEPGLFATMEELLASLNLS